MTENKSTHGRNEQNESSKQEQTRDETNQTQLGGESNRQLYFLFPAKWKTSAERKKINNNRLSIVLFCKWQQAEIDLDASLPTSFLTNNSRKRKHPQGRTGVANTHQQTSVSKQKGKRKARVKLNWSLKLFSKVQRPYSQVPTLKWFS